MALTIGSVLDAADQMLRTDAFSTAAKNGRARTTTDRRIVSRAEQERYAKYAMTYAGADQVREQRGEEGQRRTAPAALVYQTALTNLRDSVGEEVDRNATVTMEWLDELAGNGGDSGALMHLAVANHRDDPFTFDERLESLRTFFNNNDIDMGGGVWVRTGTIPQDIGARDHALQLLRDFIAEREASREETFTKSNFKTTGVIGTTNGIRAAGESVAGDAFGESGHDSTLTHATMIASLVQRMGDGVRHVSAKAKVIGEQLQGDTPVHAEVHMFFRPDGSYLTFSSIGGQASRAWED